MKVFDTVSRPDAALSFGRVVPNGATVAGTNIVDIDLEDINGLTFELRVDGAGGNVSAKLQQCETAEGTYTDVVTAGPVNGSGVAKAGISGVTKRYLKCVYVGASGLGGTAEAEIYTGV